MTTYEWSKKKVGVFGLGVEGESSARFLNAQGADVTVFEEKARSAVDVNVLQDLEQRGITCVFGGDAFSRWQGLDMIVRSPGVRRSRAEIIAAEDAGVLITSQTQLFFDLCPVDVIGITGTKGKGTTSTLIAELLKEQGMNVYLGGNIGKPPFVFLNQLTPDSKVVLELSSFQLEDLKTSPHIAVMLMVTSEHLAADTAGTANYHGSLNEYIQAKRNILAFQTEKDVAILNCDYPATIESKSFTKGAVYLVSRNRIEEGDACFVKDEMIYLRVQNNEQEVIATNEVLLPGIHNRENICAALMAAHVSGVSIASMQKVLRRFQGLEHRLELVADVNGIKYYDDSFSTTPETAIAAIQAFTGPKVLILGGSTKGSDFGELARVIAEDGRIRGIIGIGAEWERISAELKKHPQNVPVQEGMKTMSEIVAAATAFAEPGDVVLLSPACASFGLFPNYKVRGDLFKEEVKKLLK